MTDGPRLVEAGEDDAGQRIDNYLRRILKGVPKGLVYRLLRTGQVRVNKRRTKPHYKLVSGDQIRIPPVSGRASRAGKVPERLQHRLQRRILYEDDRLIVLNKPAGVPVHGGSGLHFGLIDGLRQARPDSHYLELVHRLDRETSGCLLIAKRRSTLRRLHAALRENQVKKTYQALVFGHWEAAESVRAPLQRSARDSGENRMYVSETGKASRTDFRPLAHFPGWTLVEARLHTGRTHQVRVHAAHRGHPLAADNRYGHAEADRASQALGLKRLFLHASALSFQHPDREGQVVSVEAPLDDDLASVLAQLKSGQGGE
ncbi:23S rRNA pseudouridine955/2504/2580 synthase [Natronospira proteinivora]|uniref:Pseudouridine synthase n=1 Tax=Natronospira proteinivora TaxID=1807133 RepID=A0ABT1G9U7_9GAMM|nr:RluA family pseudouridine synthase [Natronospira proteinivora]MCP1726712.1 23S rRNA pseudouridine955/2504/2580 synthase [Natronospira proteinivora]